MAPLTPVMYVASSTVILPQRDMSYYITHNTYYIHDCSWAKTLILGKIITEQQILRQQKPFRSLVLLISQRTFIKDHMWKERQNIVFLECYLANRFRGESDQRTRDKEVTPDVLSNHYKLIIYYIITNIHIWYHSMKTIFNLSFWDLLVFFDVSYSVSIVLYVYLQWYPSFGNPSVYGKCQQIDF
jgi:hypothetical protein